MPREMVCFSLYSVQKCSEVKGTNFLDWRIIPGGVGTEFYMIQSNPVLKYFKECKGTDRNVEISLKLTEQYFHNIQLF